MAFGALQRKSSNPQPYRPATSRVQPGQRRRLQNTVLVACAAIGIVWLLLHLLSSSSTHVGDGRGPVPAGTPEVVIVTVFEAGLSGAYIKKIKQNRDDYAKRHGGCSAARRRALLVADVSRHQGYKVFYADSSSYKLDGAPNTWALIPAMRHAMTENPHSAWFFSLSPHALFMNPELPVMKHVLEKARLESLMLKDYPVVPPDSVIHTFSHLKANNIDLVLTQDGEGLCQESFLLRQGDWARFFLDVWFDPMYRSYNFQKAEGHALVRVTGWAASLQIARQYVILLTPPRNTLFSGTRPSSRASPSFRSAPSTLTLSTSPRAAAKW